MDFNFKGLVKDAGTAFSRVVQLTEEKFGTSEKTELDAQFEHLAERSDITKTWTEKLLRDTESVLVPNPGNRIEDFLFEKIDKQRPNRLSNLEYLGLDMLEAGNDFGPGTAYGIALTKVGHCQQRLGSAQRDFITAANNCYITPLRKFLDVEMRTILKERSLLEFKRLDLDACKNKLRKARSMHGQQTAERDLRIAQSEFDRQAEITKLLLEGISSSHASHLRNLNEFVESQVRYYEQCHQIMQDLQRDMSSLSLTPTGAAPYQSNIATLKLEDSNETKHQRARVLYDYDARDTSELSLMADEVITISEIPESDPDYVMGERGRQRGKVPRAFLEIVSF